MKRPRTAALRFSGTGCFARVFDISPPLVPA